MTLPCSASLSIRAGARQCLRAGWMQTAVYQWRDMRSQKGFSLHELLFMGH